MGDQIAALVLAQLAEYDALADRLKALEKRVIQLCKELDKFRRDHPELEMVRTSSPQ